MKRILLDYRGVINDVVDVGKEFEVYDGPDAAFRWVLCPHDDVTSGWHFTEGNWIRPEARLEIDQNMKRKAAYGNIEDQLDMLYHDLKDGNLSAGAWVSHIDNVKTNIPPQREVDADDSYKEGKIQVRLHARNDPAWDYLPAEYNESPNFSRDKDAR